MHRPSHIFFSFDFKKGSAVSRTKKKIRYGTSDRARQRGWSGPQGRVAAKAGPSVGATKAGGVPVRMMTIARPRQTLAAGQVGPRAGGGGAGRALYKQSPSSDASNPSGDLDPLPCWLCLLTSPHRGKVLARFLFRPSIRAGCLICYHSRF